MSTAPRIDRIDKNYLINGGFDFFQRNAGPVAITTTPSYVAPDRFLLSYTGTITGSVTAAQVTNTLSPQTAKYAIQYAAQRNASTLVLHTEQRIEGLEARNLVNTGTASFSVWVFSPIASTQLRLTLNTPTVEDNYTSVTQLSQQTSSTVISASTWTQITFSGLAIGAAAALGLAVVVELLVPTGTDGSPQNYLITQVMFNAGSTVSNFSRAGRHIDQELSICLRYYELIAKIEFQGYVEVGKQAFINYTTHSKRAVPTITVGTYTNVENATNTPGFGSPSFDYSHWTVTVSADNGADDYIRGTLQNISFSSEL